MYNYYHFHNVDVVSAPSSKFNIYLFNLLLNFYLPTKIADCVILDSIQL